MVFSDGECPCCPGRLLHLNVQDLLECASCGLVCASDGLVAAVMPFRGEGRFRFEDCALVPMNGVLFSKAKGNTSIPNMAEIFANPGDLRQYIKTLGGGTSIKQGEALCRRFLYHLYGTLQVLTEPERAQCGDLNRIELVSTQKM